MVYALSSEDISEVESSQVNEKKVKLETRRVVWITVMHSAIEQSDKRIDYPGTKQLNSKGNRLTIQALSNWIAREVI